MELSVVIMIFGSVLTPLYCAPFQEQLICHAIDVMHQYFLVYIYILKGTFY